MSFCLAEKARVDAGEKMQDTTPRAQDANGAWERIKGALDEMIESNPEDSDGVFQMISSFMDTARADGKIDKDSYEFITATDGPLNEIDKWILQEHPDLKSANDPPKSDPEAVGKMLRGIGRKAKEKPALRGSGRPN